MRMLVEVALALIVLTAAPGCTSKGCNSDATIWQAASAGDLERVEQLLAADPLLLTAEDRNGNSAAALAILEGHNEVAIALLERGYPINPTSEQQPSLLIACVSRYTPESDAMTRYLLEHGADPNAHYAPEGWYPLHLAVNNRMQTKVRMLVAYGAKLDTRDEHGQTPLAIAERYLANARDPELRDPHGGPSPDQRREDVEAWTSMVALLRELGATV